MGSFSKRFNVPFFSGLVSDVAPGLVPWALPVDIEGHPYLIDESQYKRTTMQIRRLATDETVEPGEQSLNATGLWPRAQDNWFLGGGQLFLDNRFDFVTAYVHSGEFPSIRTRFWKSKGVDIFSEGELGLLPEYSLLSHSTNTNVQTIQVGTHIYKVDGATLKFTTGPLVSGSTFTTVTGITGTIMSVTTDGHRLWVACGSSGVFQTTEGASSATSFGSYHATFIQYVKTHLIASLGNDLQELDNSGATTLIYTHPNSSFVWNILADTPSAIIACGNAGNIAEIHAIQPDSASAGAVLDPPSWASSLPEGETINCLAYSAGSIIMGTSLGIRTGTRPDTNGVFDVNPVIKLTDDGVAPVAVMCLQPYLQYCYFGWSNYNTLDVAVPAGVLTSGLGRIDLSQFTNPGIPVYVTDVMTPDGSSGAVTSCSIFNATPYFVVAGEDIYIPTGNKVASGFLETGWVRYGTMENKILVDMNIHHDPLLAGQSIEVDVCDQFGDISVLGISDTPNTSGPTNPFPANLALGERFMVILKLSRGTDETQGPELRYWRSQSMIVPPRQDEIIVPLVFKSSVATISNDGNGQYYPMDTLAEFKFLKTLEQLGQPIVYQELGETYNCYIDQIMVSATKWNDDRSFFEGIVSVKLITLGNQGG